MKILLLLTVILILAACGGYENGNESGNESGANGEPSPPASLPVAAEITMPIPPLPMPDAPVQLAYYIVVPLIYNNAWPFENGLARVRTLDTRFRHLYGVIDREGEFFVPMEYEWISNFAYGVAWARRADLSYVLIDESGNVFFELPAGHKLRMGANFSEGLINFHIDGDGRNVPWQRGVMDTAGRVVIEPVAGRNISPFREGRASVSDWLRFEGRYTTLTSIIDTQGNVILPPSRRTSGYFSYGLAPVHREGRNLANHASWMIDRYGNEVLNAAGFSFDNVAGGLIRVTPIASALNGRPYVGFLNTLGEAAVELIYYDARSFREGLAAVAIGQWEDALWGFVDGTGREVVPPQFHRVGDFHDGMAMVANFQGLNENDEREYLWGFVNTAGEIVVEPVFQWVSDFSEGFAVVNTGTFWDAASYHPRPLGGRFALIDRWGREVLCLAAFDAVGRLSEGMLAVYSERYTGWARGHWILPGGLWGFVRLV